MDIIYSGINAVWKCLKKVKNEILIIFSLRFKTHRDFTKN